MKDINRNSIKGFTLLELLVVISIIAILLGFITASLTRSQKKGRDSRRQADIKAIQQAFEQYHLDESEYDTGTQCAAMKDVEYFPGGFPADPKPDHDDYNCTGFGTGYCVCARLEMGYGNSGNNLCTLNYGEVAQGKEYFCVVSLYH